MPITDEARADVRSRVKMAASIFRMANARYLILSGGYTYGDKVSEAAYMQGIAIREGVPKSRIILEEQSKNTYENALFTKRLAVKAHLHSLLIVTSSYHLPRARIVFRRTLPSYKLEFFSSPYPLGICLIAHWLREAPYIIRIAILGLHG